MKLNNCQKIIAAGFALAIAAGVCLESGLIAIGTVLAIISGFMVLFGPLTEDL